MSAGGSRPLVPGAGVIRGDKGYGKAINDNRSFGLATGSKLAFSAGASNKGSTDFQQPLRAALRMATYLPRSQVNPSLRGSTMSAARNDKQSDGLVSSRLGSNNSSLSINHNTSLSHVGSNAVNEALREVARGKFSSISSL
ncbi:hypothetical protein NE237_027992 [Protea cynaroides]|uniref:Uncharacterized protein n=1 Tax=Protea cynaroides TaxID=273540 RepID=A0A9Q0GRJ4_9MAGN|nr:hypothetical protein NE237_027992 [Protea cynaroides]